MKSPWNLLLSYSSIYHNHYYCRDNLLIGAGRGRNSKIFGKNIRKTFFHTKTSLYLSCHSTLGALNGRSGDGRI